ncbi:LuxR C-terminal-related transcriptional regulator [Pseudorhodoferax sp. LjRoot39]|uniref:LuxR C-terminal-related transcriptional regulator n=1 Tax=Pseudorhodoferax sp. LjRoot39 TaxID=3342328 RepID=UPI003ECF8287
MAQMRESLQQRGVSTAWLTLDSADNDVTRFLSGLEAAAAQLGLERSREQPRDVLALLAAEQAPFALFLDDFEVLREGVVMGVVRDLIEHLPRNGQLVIGSRSLPELGLGRLRARGQLLELSTELLRFTPEETAEFFKLRGAELSLDALDRAHGKTEGWVAALWLLALALQRHGTPSEVVARLSASDRDVADYLTEEVLGQQDLDVRDFLMRTSVLRHLSPPICQALLPHTDCEAMLRRLERGNVFLIPVEAAPDLYRYHSLFADFLRKWLARERPDEVARLHLAASGWYEEQGRHVPAIDHALEGGDHPHALHLLELHAHALLEQGRMRLLDKWFTSIPAELLGARPLMQVIALWASCLSQGPWTAMQALESSACASSQNPLVQAHVRALRPVLLAMMDHYEEAHEAGRQSLAQLPSGNAFIDSVSLNAMAHIVSVSGERQEALRFLEDARNSQGGSAFNRMYTETVEGMLDIREGRLQQAAARFRMAIASSSTAATYNYAHGNAWAGVPYAAVLYETNDLAAAERLLNVYLPLARDVGLPDHMISSHRMRSRIAFERGDVDAAIQTLIELDYLGRQRKLPRVTASAKLERARLLALQGHAAAAREELQRANDPTAWGTSPLQPRPAHDVDDLFIARVRVELHVGNAADLVAPLEEQIGLAQKAEHRHRALKLRLLLALTLFQSGATGAALDLAVPVLQEASREGYVRLLLDEGNIASLMLRRLQGSTTIEATQDPIFRDYLQRLIDLLGPGPTEDVPPAGASSDATAELLTRKEIRVLQLIAEGYSNTAMAEKLFVSDSTVRTHLRNINTKLNCHSRTQAMAIARRLGIIH